MKHGLGFLWLLPAIFVAGCIATAQSSATRSTAEGSFQRTLGVSGSADLDVETGSGSIDIRSGAAGNVEIRARIRVGTERGRSLNEAQDLVRQIESNPPIEQSGNTIRIGRLDSRNSRNNVSVSYELVVPEQSTVNASSGSGRQHASGIGGPLTVHTGSGSIHLEDIRGAVRANTGSGSITLAQSSSGNVDLSTGSGSVTITGVKGALRVSTGSGGIAAQGEQTGQWELQTGSGSIRIDLPPQAAFDLTAHTSSGQVYVDHPLTVQGRIDARRHEVTGKVRGGGYPLEVRTGSGDIRIQ